MAIKVRIFTALISSSIAALTLLKSSNINRSAIGGYAIDPENVSKESISSLPSFPKDGDLLTRDIYLTAATWRNASFPVENFQTYTSLFGYRTNPVTGKRQFHSGIDIAAPLGSTIRAWWGGEIVKLSDNTACGTAITIASGNWHHVYCHLKGSVKTDRTGTYLIDRSGGIILKLGQTISTGTRIGRVGMTGRTTGPHLHWGVKYNGKYVDPALILNQMYRSQQRYY
ncbi:MAG: M23 family metallopeptidase [Prochloraceae cyanobacterium]